MALYFDKQMTPDLEEYDAIALSGVNRHKIGKKGSRHTIR